MNRTDYTGLSDPKLSTYKEIFFKVNRTPGARRSQRTDRGAPSSASLTTQLSDVTEGKVER